MSRRLPALLVALVAALPACASAQRIVPDAGRLSGAGAASWRGARAALDAGDAEAALLRIEPLLGVEPWHVPSHMLRQDALESLGRGFEARAVYAAAAAERPNDAFRVLLAARAAPRGEGDREAAYRLALRLDPASAWPKIALAHELLALGESAREEATALADAGFSEEAARAGEEARARLREAEVLARAASAAEPTLAPAQAVLVDVLLASRADFARSAAAEALATAERGVDLDPADPAAHVRLARARRAAGDEPGAAEALIAARDLRPEDPRIAADLGRVLLGLRRDAEAARELRAAVAARPADALVRLDLGVALFRLGRVAESAAEFRRAAEAAPADPRPHEALAYAAAELGLREEAVRAMQAYVRAGGPDREGAARFLEELSAGEGP